LPNPVRTRSWAGVPLDERQARRRALLLDAAFDLLGTEGWDATTVRAVVERAQLNPRYFYESFEDLDELVVAVYDRVVDALAQEIVAAIAETIDDPIAHAREVLRRIIEFVDEDRRRGRVLYVEGLGNEALNRRRREAGQAVVAFIERVAGDEGEPFNRVAASIVVGGLSQLLVDWLDGHIKGTRKSLIDEATRLFLALGAAAVR
jgi:AcrR family transcriptional regulator